MAPSFFATSSDWTHKMARYAPLMERIREIVASLKESNNAPSLKELAQSCRDFLGRVLKKKGVPASRGVTHMRFVVRRQHLYRCRHGPAKAV